MSILQNGIASLRDDIEEITCKDPEVQSAETELYDELHSLKDLLGHERYCRLEEAINATRAAELFAAFRIGVTEGLKLANAVRALIGPEGAVPDGSK